jgi:pilus assembly protein CpaE
LKIAILSSNKSHMESVRQVLLQNAPARQVLMFNEGDGPLSAVVDQEHPDLMILDGVCCTVDRLGKLEELAQRYPTMAILMMCENAPADFLISAMRVGVRDVLQLPLVPNSLLEAVARVEQRQRPVAGSERPKGKVIAFIACKGGSGATFLASNVGYILAANENAKVALLDLNLQFGDAALFVSDQVPANTVSDVSENIARLDASLLASSMVPVLPNYGLLAAPEDPGHASSVRPEHVEVIITMAKANYDYVILDIGRILSATSVQALDKADLIFPVLQETLPFIRDSKRLIRTLQTLGYSREKIRPIVNRHAKGGDIMLADVEAALGMKVFTTIPNSYETVSKSVNQGIAIFKLAKHDPVTKALTEMTQRLFSEGQQQKKSSWLPHLFSSK